MKRASAALRRDLRCADCGYGAVLAHPPERCPMCGATVWRIVGSSSAIAAPMPALEHSA